MTFKYHVYHWLVSVVRADGSTDSFKTRCVRPYDEFLDFLKRRYPTALDITLAAA